MASADGRSPAHRAALGFLQGGLISVVALALPAAVGPVAAALSLPASVVALARTLVPLLGFGAGGAVGGESLGFGFRGSVAFGAGGVVAGLVLLVTAPNLRGLTGFEPPLVVAAYGVLSSVAAFGADGAIAGLLVRRGRVPWVTAGFAAAGALGGLLGVAPGLAARSDGGWLPELRMFFGLACTIGSIVAPLVIGGSASARTWSEKSPEPSPGSR
jgi:hypothetical protein